MTHSQASQKVARLEYQGFSATPYNIKKHRWAVRYSCDSCQPMSIQGVPCHESGCPNEKHECAGCNELLPKEQKYCEDCQ